MGQPNELRADDNTNSPEVISDDDCKYGDRESCFADLWSSMGKKGHSVNPNASDVSMGRA